MSQKLTISEMQALARTHGGKCLSLTYAGAHSKLKWQCVKGHKWEARPSNVKTMGIWCVKCSGTKPMATIEEMQALAGRYRGKCLSKVYRGLSKKLRWRCAKGHEWESAPSIVKNGGYWCRECSGSKGTIEAMQALAKKHKGECLSSTYVGLKNKHRWRCAKGHEWETTPNSIKYMGTWCPKCSGKTALGTIEEMQALAKKHGGECLSLTYVGALKKLRWRCAKGHEWKTTPSSVKNAGTWCPKCSGNKQGTIEEMQALARTHGGKCLSSTYAGTHSKLKWQCAKGHKWEARPSSVKTMGTWCAKCSGTKPMATIEEMQALARRYRGKCLSKVYRGSNKKLQWQCAKGHKWEAAPTSVKNGGYWCRECRKARKRMKDKCGRMNFTTAKQKK